MEMSFCKKNIWAQFTAVFLSFFGFSNIQASQWIDPTWDQIIDDASVIGLFEVTEGGMNRAQIKAVKILKGELEKDEIVIQGFNDSHWPEEAQKIQSLKAGQKIYVFLSDIWLYQWRGLTRKQILKEWGQVEGSLSFRVPSPTAGVLRVEKGNKVHYALDSPSYSWTRFEHETMDFEKFVQNTVTFKKTGRSNEKDLHEILIKIGESLVKKEEDKNQLSLSHYLGLYRYWGGSGLIKEMEKILSHSNAEVRYEATKIIGRDLPNEKAKEWLIQLLDDPHTLIQGLAVRQLMTLKEKNEIGKIFTDKLSESLAGSTGPSHLLDPVQNRENGGLLEMLQALVELNYREASGEIAKVMGNSTDTMVLEKSYFVLKRLKSDLYIEPLIHHIKGENTELRDTAIDLAHSANHPKLRIPLENLLAATEPGDYEATDLIAALRFKESLSIIEDWLNRLCKKNSPSTWDDNSCAKALEVFQEIDPKGTVDLAEKVMFFWTGVDSKFLENSNLLKIRRDLEKDIKEKVFAAIPKIVGKSMSVHCLVLLENRIEISQELKTLPQYWYHVDIVMKNNTENSVELSHDQLKEIREIIARNSEISVNRLGIHFQSGQGSYWRASNTDERVFDYTGWDIMSAAIELFEISLPDNQKKDLLQFYLDSGVARSMDSEDIIRRVMK